MTVNTMSACNPVLPVTCWGSEDHVVVDIGQRVTSLDLQAVERPISHSLHTMVKGPGYYEGILHVYLSINLTVENQRCTSGRKAAAQPPKAFIMLSDEEKTVNNSMERNYHNKRITFPDRKFVHLVCFQSLEANVADHPGAMRRGTE